MQLTSAQVEILNEIDAAAEDTGRLVETLETRARTQGDVDPRFVAIARTQLQLGFMALNRAVCRPETFG